MAKVVDLVEENVNNFRKLTVVGVKELNTALLYLSIFKTWESYKSIDKPFERKQVVASVCKCSYNTVCIAINLMQKNVG